MPLKVWHTTVVDQHNFVDVYPRMVAAAAGCSFVAVDTEFSGLSRKLRHKDVQARYLAFREHVEERSLLQIGIAFFTRADATAAVDDTLPTYSVDMYDILVVREGDFTAKTSALQFLAGAGLDLNRVFRHGVRYSTMAQLARRQQAAAARQRRSKHGKQHRAGQRPRSASHSSTGSRREEGARSQASAGTSAAPDGSSANAATPPSVGASGGSGAGAAGGTAGVKRGRSHSGGSHHAEDSVPSGAAVAATAAEPPPSLHQLWARLSAARKPLVVHNGWLDLVFLYHAFGGELPRQLSTFSSRLVAWFPCVYDTKFIAEHIANERVSFLAFMFQRCVRAGKVRLDPPGLLPMSRARPLDQGPVSVCEEFALHGHCRQGDKCVDSHDLDDALDFVHDSSRKRQRVGSQGNGAGGASASPTPASVATAGTVPSGTPPAPGSDDVGAHSAVFDALATGFSFATFQAAHRPPHSPHTTGAPAGGAASAVDGGAAPGPVVPPVWEAAVNRLYIGGHEHPLILRKKPKYTPMARPSQAKRRA